jgi:3-oxoacyl-[acyl-carrier protein] reductase
VRPAPCWRREDGLVNLYSTKARFHFTITERNIIMELGLNRRTAVITGASKGVGKAIARGLAAEGVNVVLLARGQDLLEQAAAQIREEHGVQALALPTDMTDAEQVAAAAAAATQRFGTIHILVNNVGRPPRRQDRQINWSDAEWLEEVDLKTIGMLRAVRACLPHMVRDGAGRIINISGVAATNVWAPALTLGLNNAAMNQVTAYLAHDLAGAQITVNAVTPGPVATEWREAWVAAMAQQQGQSSSEFLAAFCRQKGILAGRLAEMDEISDLVVFLASDRARYINGAKLVIDGGFSVNAR